MTFSEGDRVQVVNQSLDTWGMYGTVRLVDRHEKVWVRLDGYGKTQYLPFAPTDLAGGKPDSPLLYGDEPSQNLYMGPTGPIGA